MWSHLGLPQIFIPLSNIFIGDQGDWCQYGNHHCISMDAVQNLQALFSLNLMANNPWVHPPPPLLNQVNPTWLIKTPLLFSHSRPYSPSTMLPMKMTYSTVVCSAPPVLLALWWPRWLRADLRINVFQAAAEISFSFSDFAVDCGRNCGLCPK